MTCRGHYSIHKDHIPSGFLLTIVQDNFNSFTHAAGTIDVGYMYVTFLSNMCSFGVCDFSCCFNTMEEFLQPSAMSCIFAMIKKNSKKYCPSSELSFCKKRFNF